MENNFELEGTMKIGDGAKDLILNEFGYVRCFYCGTLIAPETYYCEIIHVKTKSRAIMCLDCLAKSKIRKEQNK